MRALIAILPGDGIGPEVTAEAARVLAEGAACIAACVWKGSGSTPR